MSAIELDNLYDEYVETPEHNRDEVLLRFARALERDARAITWHKLQRVDEEIVTDTLAHTLMGLSKFEGRSRFSTWHYRIVENRCLKALRQQKQRAEVELAEDQPDFGAERLGEKAEAKIQMEWLLSDLTDEERQLAIWKMEGLRDAEIAAEIPGLSAKGVNTRWRRLLAKLREKAANN